MSEYLYVCHFSNGHIKVGRSISPKSRIASHADRVACLGVELVEHSIFECVGHSAPAEFALIDRCAELATKRNKNEWFEGLEYMDVCELADSFAKSGVSRPSGFNEHVDSAFIDHLGGPAKVAELLNMTGAGGRERVQNWKTRGIPAKVKVDFPHIFMRKRKPADKAQAAPLPTTQL